MYKIAFYDTKPYDEHSFEDINHPEIEFKFLENKLNKHTATLAKDCDGVCAFVNDDIGKETINELYDNGIRLIAMRCSGYNNIDLKEAKNKITVVRVPGYSPYAVAEHAMGLILCLNRKIHKAYFRTRDYNFSLNGLTGFDLYGKTVGIIGTGKIGKVFAEICKGFGMNVIAYDLFPDTSCDINYVSREQLFKESDIISLHCPLTAETKHIINSETIRIMKSGVFIINTSRGGLVESESLYNALRDGRVGAAGLDVYEEESDLFFEDHSDTIIRDDIIKLFLSLPNVLISSHQAFLTKEALHNIAMCTIQNILDYFEGKESKNVVLEE
ncbi:MAG: 2-hydroxyacid dehydrogenase [Lachnospiraceae bacterium]|nr:2-hydroxyacid dehydrogenase [Lachnospiraceae bacterium]